MVQFDEYFDQLTHKLSERGFSVSRNVDSGGTHLDLIATRSAVELTKMGRMSRFMIASSMDHVDKKVIGQYIIHSVNYYTLTFKPNFVISYLFIILYHLLLCLIFFLFLFFYVMF